MAKGKRQPNTGEIKTVSLIGVDPLREGRISEEPERLKSNAPDIATLIVLVIVLTAFGVMSFVLPKPEISQIENRPLEKAPGFSTKALASGEFTDAFSRYYSDTFPWREKMIETSSDFKSLFGLKGKESGEDVSIHYGVDTAEGQDDASSATPDDSGTNNATNDGETAASSGAVSSSDSDSDATTEPGATSDGTGDGQDATTTPAATTPQPAETEDAGGRLTGEGKREGGVIVIGDTGLEFYGFAETNNERYANIINKFDDKYRGQVTTTALVSPTNIEFKLPEQYSDLSDDQRQAINFIYEHLNTDVVKVDVYDSLKAHANEYVYFRTDHHWTQLGAYYAYRDYCKTLGLPHTALLSYSRIRLDGFLGSFYNSIGGNKDMKKNPDFVLAYAPVVPYETTGYFDSAMNEGFNLSLIRGPDEIEVSNKYLAFSGGDLPIIDIKMQSDTGRRLIIFKESFANAFIPFLTENYDEIIIVDFRYYEGSVDNLIQKYQINEALFLNYVSAAGSERQVDRLSALFD